MEELRILTGLDFTYTNNGKGKSTASAIKWAPKPKRKNKGVHSKNNKPDKNIGDKDDEKTIRNF